MKTLFRLVLILAVVLSARASFAQVAATSRDGLWQVLDSVPAAKARSEAWVRPLAFTAVQLDFVGMQRKLRAAPMEFTVAAQQLPLEVTLPMPDGSFARFLVVESPVMAPELAAMFPEIKTYVGQGVDDPRASARLDITPAGFHAQILTPGGAFYIDPYSKGDTELYASYYRRDFRRDAEPFECLTPASATRVEGDGGAAGILRTGPMLRTYRLACAATGEYTAFHGGTVSNGLAAIVTAVNRVTGIYEIEVAVRLVLVANNHLLVYTNASTDPYTNNNGSTMLGQNQSNIDSVIGNANYDIGHVFSTGGGGIAGLGVVCVTGNKARGVTGSSSPIGDPFYVDYVAHEIGHQFGANHTFNSVTSSCGGGNRNASTAYEPGSGSTIMAYAGICGADNLQANSDPYFHSISFDEILNYITSGSGSGCPVTTSTGNTAPTVNTGPNRTIPANTPFMLTAGGSDPDGDALTFCWEERDLGPAQTLTDPDNGSSPLFRSFNPTTNQFRIFPKLSDVLNNTTNLGEKLPTTSRTLNFRVTARDNRSGGGGVNTADMALTVTTSAGPFRVTAPNSGVTWSGVQTVAWNVANTVNAPVNASHVNILLSTNGGLTFPITLASNTPNDGTELVVLPNTTSSQARVMVQANNNVFFDVSDTNFSIAFSSPIALVIGAGATLTSETCGPTNGVMDPGEAVTVSFALHNVGTADATNVVATLLPGFGVSGPSGPQNYGTLTAGVPAVSRTFSFTATGACGGAVSARFHVQAGTNDFGIISNAFGLGAFFASTITDATTNNIKIPASGTSGAATPYPANILVSGVSGAVNKVTVTLVGFGHTYPDDVDVLLVGPAGQKVLLMSDCGGGFSVSSLTLTFDDAAGAFLPDSTAISSGTYKPSNYDTTSDAFQAPAPGSPYGALLSAFNDQSPNGTWSLYVRDDASQDTGNITGGWRLTITTLIGPTCCASAEFVDLSVVKTSAVSAVGQGGSLGFSFYVTNRGPSTAAGLQLVDPLPANLTFVSATPSQGSCSNVGGSVICDLGSLASNASATVTMVVVAASAGVVTNTATVSSQQSELNVTNNTASRIVSILSPPQLVVIPSNRNYGVVAVGQSSSLTFSVINSGQQSLTGSAAVGGPFAVTGGGFYSVAAGQTATMTVAFNPVAEGTFSNNVIFTSNGGGSTNPVTGIAAVVPTANFTGSPTSGAAPLHVTFTNLSVGTITNRLWNFGDGATSAAVHPLHTYTNAGTYTVSLTVFGPLGTNVSTQEGYITVTNAPPLLLVSPPSRHFGTVFVGATSNLSFMVVNGGQLELTGTAVVGGPFAVAAGSPFSILSGQTGVVTVSFTPGADGAFSNDVVFASNGGGSTNPVTGMGLTPPALGVHPSSYDFGYIATGTTAQFSFTVTNSGGAALTGEVSVTGDIFAVVAGSPFNIGGSAATSVVVSFNPPAEGEFSNNVVFTSNGGGATNPVTGVGAVIPTALFSASPTSGAVPLIVAFTNLSTGTITNYAWDFGDGSATNGANPSHTYETAGVFTVTLVVVGPLGASTNALQDYIAATNFVAVADVQIAGAADPDPVEVLNELTVTLVVSNAGPALATSVTVTNLLSPGIAVASLQASQGSCTQIGDTVACELGNLAENEAAAIEIVMIPQTPGAAINHATVGSDAVDPDDSNNMAIVSASVLAVADLELVKEATPDPVEAGEELTYTLVITNRGPSSASQVLVTDPLPAGLDVLSISTTHGDCSETGGVVMCDLGTLHSGVVAKITIVTTASSLPGALTIPTEGLLVNAGFEQAQDGLLVPAAPGFTNGWQSRSTALAEGRFSSEEKQSGNLSMKHAVQSGEVSPGNPRYTRIAQDYQLSNSNNLPVRVTLDGYFKGDLTATTNDALAVAFLRIELLDATSNVLLVVDNEIDDDHNGAPLLGVLAMDWTNVVLTVTNGPAATRVIRFMTGLSQNGTTLAHTGYWDRLSATVSLTPRLTNTAALSSATIDPDPDNNAAAVAGAFVAALDTDGDGMPDWWENIYGGSATGLVFDADDDMDGMSNYEEYIADTDPLGPASFLVLDDISGGPGITLRFRASSLRSYLLQYSSNLNFNIWQDLDGEIPGTDGTISVTDTNGAPAHRHYRLKAKLP